MLRSHRHISAFAAASVAAFVTLLVAADYWGAGRFADAAALSGFEGVRLPVVRAFAAALAASFDPYPYVVVGLGLTCLVARRSLRDGAAVLMLLGGANVSSQMLKPLLAHWRPLAGWGVRQVPAAAFPSGHATAAMALAFAFVLIAPRQRRLLVAALGSIMTVALSFSILVLGWHFPSDVIGGYLLATFWMMATLTAARAVDSRWPEAGGVRRAARRAVGSRQRLPLGTAPTVALGAAVGALAASTGGRLAAIAGRHSSFVAAVMVIAISACALVVGVAALSDRPG